jgi:hypothetical protein
MMCSGKSRNFPTLFLTSAEQDDDNLWRQREPCLS